MAEAIKPYSIDDLYKAMDDWRMAKNRRLDQERERDIKKAAMESNQREVDRLLSEERRFEAVVRKVLGNLEKS